MFTPRCKLAACLMMLVASTTLSVAQSSATPTDTGTNLTTAALPQAPESTSTPAPTDTIARSFWDDPKIKPSETLAENAWDFTDPNGVPGFGPLPPTVTPR